MLNHWTFNESNTVKIIEFHGFPILWLNSINSTISVSYLFFSWAILYTGLSYQSETSVSEGLDCWCQKMGIRLLSRTNQDYKKRQTKYIKKPVVPKQKAKVSMLLLLALKLLTAFLYLIYLAYVCPVGVDQCWCIGLNLYACLLWRQVSWHHLRFMKYLWIACS